MVADRRYRETVLGVVVLANFVQLGARLLVSPVVPDIVAVFDVSKAAVGVALTGMWGAYALLQYPSGVLADRFGARPLVLAALAGTALGSGLLALAPTFPVFALCVLLLGAGTGLFFAVGASLLSDLYENTGQALGFLTGGGAVAGTVAPAVAGAVAPRFGWRVAVALGAAAAVPTLVLAARLVRDHPPTAPELSVRERLEGGPIRDLLGRPRVAFTAGVAVLAGFCFQSFASFFPTFLVEYRSLDQSAAGFALGGAFLLIAVAQPAAGRLSDRIGRDATIGAAALVAAAGFAALLAVPGRAGLLGGVALLGAGISWPGVLQARVMDAVPGEERGTGFGLVRTVYMLLAALGSAVTGALADLAGWPAAFGLVVALLATVAAALAANRALGLGL